MYTAPPKVPGIPLANSSPAKDFFAARLASFIRLYPAPTVTVVPSISISSKRSNLIITRAGASTIAEITAIGIPSILIPSPYVTHNHQYKNAKVLEDAGASIIIEEEKLDSKILIKTIDEILKDSKKYDIMKENSERLGVKDSSSKIYEIIKKLVDEG